MGVHRNRPENAQRAMQQPLGPSAGAGTAWLGRREHGAAAASGAPWHQLHTQLRAIKKPALPWLSPAQPSPAHPAHPALTHTTSPAAAAALTGPVWRGEDVWAARGGDKPGLRGPLGAAVAEPIQVEGLAGDVLGDQQEPGPVGSRRGGGGGRGEEGTHRVGVRGPRPLAAVRAARRQLSAHLPQRVPHTFLPQRVPHTHLPQRVG